MLRRTLLATVLVLLVLAAPANAAGVDLAQTDRVQTGTAQDTSPGGDEITVAAVIDRGDGLVVVRVQARPEDAADTARHLEALPDVVTAEIDHPVRAFGDPLRQFQWGLDRLRADLTWSHGNANGQTVAVVDTGVDANHPDLAGVLVGGFDALDGSSDGGVDPNGHGTHVAGIIAAVAGNGIGVEGFAPGAKVMPIRVLNEQGTGFSSDVAEGILWAASNGATVVNLSLGSPDESSVVTTAIGQAVSRGVVVVAASGNEGAKGNPVIFPASLDNVIGVGAIDQGDAHASFSGNGDWLDVVAPGVQIASTMNGDYMYSTGTSMAAPFVSATAALVRARHTSLDPAGVATHLATTSEDLGATGFDPLFGHGLIDPVAALSTTPGGTAPVEVPEEPVEEKEAAAEPVVARVGTSQDMARTAVDISKATFPADERAAMAILARDDSFADSLAGSALIGDRGPILYTTGGPAGGLRSETAAELRRVLRPGGKVVVLGGPNAVSEIAVGDVQALGFAVERLQGPSRVETAVAIADAVPGGGGRVLLARADSWADAVTGGAYAASEGIPLLLTQSNALHPAVAAYLAAHRPSEVVLLGGEAALSGAVASAISTKTTRVSGPTRAGTAVAVAERLWGRTAGRTDDHFVVTDGWGQTSWAPALAASVLSAKTVAPQLVVNGADSANPLPPETHAYLDGLGYSSGKPASATMVGPLTGASVADSLSGLLGG